MQITIQDITTAFPDYRVAFVVAEGLTIAPDRPAALDALIAQREAAARERWAGAELSPIPGIAAWRAAYKAFGIKQTRYRSSVERLVKNVLAGRELARVNAFVDLYNAVSLAYVLPLGADDLDQRDAAARVPLRAGGRQLRRHGGRRGGRRARGAEARRGGLRRRGPCALPPLELAAGCALHHPAGETRRAVVTVQSNGAGDVAAGAADLVDLIDKYCGGVCRVEILDRTRPTADL